MRVLLQRRAANYFSRLDERLKQQLRDKLEELVRDPRKMPGVKAMRLALTQKTVPAPL